MYNKDFRKQMEQFDKDFARTQKIFTIWSTITILLTIAILSGIGFIIFKLLAFFGVL